jgi:hypothetical protein
VQSFIELHFAIREMLIFFFFVYDKAMTKGAIPSDKVWNMLLNDTCNTIHRYVGID